MPNSKASMINTIFTEYHNWLNKMLIQQWKILFANNCLSHTGHSFKCDHKYLLKNMMSRFKPFKQVRTDPVMKGYTWYMMGEQTTAMETSDRITKLARQPEVTVPNVFQMVWNPWRHGLPLTDEPVDTHNESVEQPAQMPNVKANEVETKAKTNQANEAENKVNDANPMTISLAIYSLNVTQTLYIGEPYLLLQMTYIGTYSLISSKMN